MPLDINSASWLKEPQQRKENPHIENSNEDHQPFSLPHIQNIILPLIESVYSKSNGYQLSIGYKAPQFVYGELYTLFEYYKLFSHSINLKSKSAIFTDLGSGIGKANLVVAGCFDINKSIGIELIPKMHEHSKKRKNEFVQRLMKKEAYMPRIKFFRGNITRTWEKWKDSDVVFMNCVCWKKNMIEQVTKMLMQLKPGSEVFSTNPIPALQLVSRVECKTGWSDSRLFLYST